MIAACESADEGGNDPTAREQSEEREMGMGMGMGSWSAKALYDEKAIEALGGARGDEFKKAEEKARPGLEMSSRVVAALLRCGGMSSEAAIEKALAPDAAAFLSIPPEIPLRRLLSEISNEQAEQFGSRPEALGALIAEEDAALAMWVFPDGSALATLRGGASERASKALAAAEIALEEEQAARIGALWPGEAGGMGERIGRRALAAAGIAGAIFALDPKEAREFALKVANPRWPCERESQKKIELRDVRSGAEITGEEFAAKARKALDRKKAEILGKSLERLDAARRERKLEERANWREALLMFMRLDSDRAKTLGWLRDPHDAGFAAFLMESPGTFTQKSIPMWKKAYEEVCELLGTAKEGEGPGIAKLSEATSYLGAEVGTRLSHFLYRYHRSGGPNVLAARVFEEMRERSLEDARERSGVAAIMSKREEALSKEAREAGRAASSVEFSVQYGAALALHAALWGRETKFESLPLLAKAFIRSLRGANEISMECFGWLSVLIRDFSEEGIKNESLVGVFLEGLEQAEREAEKAKSKGGKITIENEWSGRWSHELAGRKIREYLGMGLERESESAPEERALEESGSVGEGAAKSESEGSAGSAEG